jgi:glycolate oxidase
MDLTKDAYRALEDVVGPENISQDTAARDSYNQVWGNKLVFGEKWSNQPAAVLMPETTEEVQSIVRVCNRHKISFKPFSSGFEIMSTALASENAIILDLKRMNRILDIDVKNMHAVVEPYVSVYRLEMELAKYGLYIGTISAGPEAGVIASHCCHFGSGSTQVYAGGLGRNVLGCEWVLPTGEIVRMGSAEAGSGWYSADGPGFSLRGILRGHSGANGGHGVITKCSAKLYHWYGPPEWELKGSPPAVKRLEKVPDGFKSFVPTFATRDDAYDALREVGQAEIGFSVMMLIGGEMCEGNDEFWEMFQKVNPEEMQRLAHSLLVVIGANTTREMEYRERCLHKIVDKWHGQFLPPLNDPQYLALRFALMVWSIGTVRETFRPCSEFFITPCTDATEDMIKIQNTAAVERLKPYVQRGVIMQPGSVPFHLPYENYSVGSHIETIILFDPYNDNSLQGVREWTAETFDPKGKFSKFGVPCLGGGLQIEPVSHVVQNWGPVYDNYDVWLRKIKDALDPNNLGDWSAYVPPVFP